MSVADDHRTGTRGGNVQDVAMRANRTEPHTLQTRMASNGQREKCLRRRWGADRGEREPARASNGGTGSGGHTKGSAIPVGVSVEHGYGIGAV